MSIVLKAIFETLHRSGVSSLLRPWTQGLGVIFCMHRVRPESGSDFAPNANLESTPEFLDAALTMLKAQGYDLVSMDEVAVRLKKGNDTARPFAAFTLDDGYRDNVEFALPVFRRHNCPFMVYVAPGLVDGTAAMWWLALEEIIAREQKLKLTINRAEFDISARNSQEKTAAWKTLSPRIQNLPELEQREWIRHAAGQSGLDLRKQCLDAILSWEELRQLAKQPLASIGAHTMNHFALKRLDGDTSRDEIVASRTRLERELGVPVRHLAYPYGNVAHAGHREFRFAEESGFKTSVTTRLGTVFPDHARHLQALPRVMVSGKYQRERWLQVLAAGLPGMLANTGKRLNVS